MNKNIKKVIAIVLTISGISAVTPASISNYNPIITGVYASSSDYRLSDINVETVSGNNDVTLYEKSSYKNKLNDSETLESKYYGKVSSGKSKIKINVDKENSSSKVKIFKGSKSYDEDDEISLSSGKNTIYICVYDESKDEDDMNKSNGEKKYTLEIKRGSSSSSSSSDDDNVYLKNISIYDNNDNDVNVDFSKSTNTYNLKVKSSVDEVEIKAKPDADEEDYDDYTVRIDDVEVDDDDSWKHKVELKKGKNKIVIEVENDSDKRSYTLNITRGDVSSTSDSIYLDSLSVGATNLTLSETKKEWNLKFDSDAKKVAIVADPKSADYTVTIDGDEVDDDNNYKKTVELEEDKVKTFKVKVKNTSGTEQVYTLNLGRGDVKSSDFPVISTSSNTVTNNNNNNSSTNNTVNATITNDWVFTNGNWQFNDISGNPIKNAWKYYEKNGQLYYLDEYGNMATYWKSIGGNWYYFGYDGARKTGWQFDGKAWYYMDASGIMLSNTYIGRYRLGASGAWIQ